MATAIEERLSRHLRSVCGDLSDGADLSQASDLDEMTSSLEFFLQASLCAVDPFWRKESLDGLQHELAIKAASRQVELAGRCILMSDQTVTSYHVELRVAAALDEIEWFDCRLGELVDGTLVRLPYDRGRGLIRIPTIANRLDSIKWRFHVGFGHRELDP